MEVRGSEGYAEVASQFCTLSESIDFDAIHACLLPLLPDAGGRVLDVGAGSGRDAAALAARGYDVVAIEPTPAFLQAARDTHRSPRIHWLADGLPDLASLEGDRDGFDFVGCHAVWQHVPGDERARAMARVAALLRPGGVFAVGLRHGPAGAGTYYFPPDVEGTIGLARDAGLSLALRLDHQPSALPHKTHVTWTRLAFRAPSA